jgi:hypothetical protein
LVAVIRLEARGVLQAAGSLQQKCTLFRSERLHVNAGFRSAQGEIQEPLSIRQELRKDVNITQTQLRVLLQTCLKQAARVCGDSLQIRLFSEYLRKCVRCVLAFEQALARQYSTTPQAQISARRSTRLPLACSGAMYAAVPRSVPATVASSAIVGESAGSPVAASREGRCYCL